MSETRLYEAVLVFDSNMNDGEVEQEIANVKTVCDRHQGNIENTDLWGRRKLAYEIDKKQYGIYAVLNISGAPEMVPDLDRQLRINENVIRHLVVTKDKFAPDRSEEEEDRKSSKGANAA